MNARWTQGSILSSTKRFVEQPRRWLIGNAIGRSRTTWSKEDRETLDSLRRQYVDQVSVSKYESHVEARQRAQNEWRWIVGAAKERVKDSDEKVADVLAHVRQMTERSLEADEPLAYVLGNQPFGPLSIVCRSPTLIPRVETEALVEHVVDFYVGQLKACHHGQISDKPVRILDLCCGTGCIALLLRHRLVEYARSSKEPIKADILAIDSSSEAVELARENYGLQCASDEDNVDFNVRLVDLFDEKAMRAIIHSHGPFNVIVCNPPYIPRSDWLSLENSVRMWEDERALVGDTSNGSEGDGLDFYRRLCELFNESHCLASFSSIPALVAVECGHDQAASVQKIFHDSCLSSSIWRDQFGIQRAVLLTVS